MGVPELALPTTAATNALVVAGPLTLRASSSSVRQYTGWKYTVEPAVEATLSLSKVSVRTANPADEPALYMRFRLLNESVDEASVATSGPRSDAPLHLTLPAGLVPELAIELWSRGATSNANDDDMLASGKVELGETTGSQVRHFQLRRRGGLDPKVYKTAPPTVSFDFHVDVTDAPAVGWSAVALTSPQPGVSARAVWPEAVLRSLAKANDRSDPNGAPSAIHDAAAAGRDEEVRELIDGGAPIEARALRGWTPLVFAVRAGALGAVRELLAAGADPNARDRRGSTALARAAFCARGSNHILRALLAAGADIEASDDYGRRPLHVAADNGQLGAVRLLLHKGAARDARDNDGKTPCELAAAEGRDDIVALFEKMRKQPVRCAGGLVVYK